MKKTVFLILVFCITISWAQDRYPDFALSNDTRISWLGIDFSHVALIGDFSHFAGIGEKSPSQIKSQYFPAWNRLILNERSKYDIKGMLRRDDIFYDIDMIDSLNAATPVCDIQQYNNPNYTVEDIQKFISTYNLVGKAGIGIVLLAESLNKAENVAYFHFVAIEMPAGKILIHERVSGEPGGFGIRNYWAGSILSVMEQIENIYYRQWWLACARE